MTIYPFKTVMGLFAFYGHVGCPLTENQIRQLLSQGKSFDEIYSIGCDVACGFPFEEAYDANTVREGINGTDQQTQSRE